MNRKYKCDYNWSWSHKWFLFLVVSVCLISLSAVSSGHKTNNADSHNVFTTFEKGKDISVDNPRKREDNSNNELGKFDFGEDDDHDLDHDNSSGEDDSSYVYDSFEDVSKPDDADFIKKHDKHDDHDQDSSEGDKPVIAKCCGHGEGMTLRGNCEKFRKKNYLDPDQNNFWFPEKVYDDVAGKMIHTNMSSWEVVISHKIECHGKGQRPETMLDMKRFSVLKDGSLYAYDHQRVIHPLQFCADLELGSGQGRVIRACFTKEELCEGMNCLRKCCPKGSVSEVVRGNPNPSMRCHQWQGADERVDKGFQNYSLSISTPSCEDGTSLEVVEKGSFRITENGSLETPTFTAPLLEYCLDYFLPKSLVEGKHSDADPVLKAMVCFGKGISGDFDHQGLIVVPPGMGVLFGITMIISTICLAIAAAISWRLPELRSLHGKCQLSHLLTMFFLYFCLAIVQLWTNNVPQWFCTFLGVFIHICSISSFLWLNLLCVNIYLTFRSLRPPLAARRDENRRLIFLCIYAWGIPAAFCLFLYALDASPGRLDPMPSPEYGKLKCLISNRQAEFAYLFGPVGVLLLCNGLLFCLTAQELLCGVWRLDNSDSINFRRKSMGIVVAKLGIVMGMGWILDVISWGVGARSPYMFYAADLFNSFQGVLIAVILLWRKRVLEVLHLRKPSISKDETLTARPFLPKTGGNANVMSNGDHDTSLVLVQDS